jgi:hypothetical protein
MPTQDYRTRTGVDKGRQLGAGYRQVGYRNVDGTTSNARVIAQGTGSGLKLSLPSFGGAVKIIDNVAKATGLKQTNVYFIRHQ